MINSLTVQLVCTSDVEIVFLQKERREKGKRESLPSGVAQHSLQFGKQDQLKM